MTSRFWIFAAVVGGALSIAMVFLTILQTGLLGISIWPAIGGFSEHKTHSESTQEGSIMRRADAASLPVVSKGMTTPTPKEQDRVAAASRTELGAKDDNTKDAVANSMTAVGTAVAAITLVLSLGTLWFSARQRELQELIGQQRKALSDSEARIRQSDAALNRLVSRAEARLSILNQLVVAKRGIIDWVFGNSDVLDKGSIALEYCLWLEALMSECSSLRRDAFQKLTADLPLSATPELRSVEEYGDACHAFHCGENHPSPSTTHGMWCRLFSETERSAFVESIRFENGGAVY